jgi:hypothetical protein
MQTKEHLPATHDVLTVFAAPQTLPHVPQFSGSVIVSMQPAPDDPV